MAIAYFHKVFSEYLTEDEVRDMMRSLKSEYGSKGAANQLGISLPLFNMVINGKRSIPKKVRDVWNLNPVRMYQRKKRK